MDDNIAIRVNGVCKDFLLPHEKTNSLKSSFLQRIKVGRGKTEHQHALRDISFDVKKGEFFGIVGRNGSGKSTLLKILAEIYKPTSGSIKVNGKLVPFIELGVGFNPELTGRDNVYLSATLLGFSRQQINNMYDDIVEFAELSNFMDQKLKNYSSGMQVRLAFSIATRVESDILLIDEVLAVGDADFQRKCFEYFKYLKKNGKTVVFVSHDMGAVREYCDRAVLIDNSQLKLDNQAEKVAQAYLKLFNKTDQSADETDVFDSPDNRWGNGQIRYTTISCIVTAKDIKIACTAKAKTSVTLANYGFRLRSTSGQEVLGINSKILKVKTPDLDSGELLEIEWTIPNILSNGTYFVEPSIVLSDDTTVCDWWNEAKKIVVEKSTSTTYVVTPDIKLTAKTSR